jgi:hypothetical protein
MTSRLSIQDQPWRNQATASCLCLQDNLSCTVIAQRLALLAQQAKLKARSFRLLRPISNCKASGGAHEVVGNQLQQAFPPRAP